MKSQCVPALSCHRQCCQSCCLQDAGALTQVVSKQDAFRCKTCTTVCLLQTISSLDQVCMPHVHRPSIAVPAFKQQRTKLWCLMSNKHVSPASYGLIMAWCVQQWFQGRRRRDREKAKAAAESPPPQPQPGQQAPLSDEAIVMSPSEVWAAINGLFSTQEQYNTALQAAGVPGGADDPPAGFVFDPPPTALLQEMQLKRPADGPPGGGGGAGMRAPKIARSTAIEAAIARAGRADAMLSELDKEEARISRQRMQQGQQAARAQGAQAREEKRRAAEADKHMTAQQRVLAKEQERLQKEQWRAQQKHEKEEAKRRKQEEKAAARAAAQAAKQKEKARWARLVAV